MNILHVYVQFVPPREVLATVIARNDDIGVHTAPVTVQVLALLESFGARVTRECFLF